MRIGSYFMHGGKQKKMTITRVDNSFQVKVSSQEWSRSRGYVHKVWHTELVYETHEPDLMANMRKFLDMAV